MQYLHFQSKPLMNHYIFATVYSLMKYIHLIDICQAHLPVQYASNIEFIRQSDTGVVVDSEPHLRRTCKNPLVCSFGRPCSHWLFRFFVLHSNITVKTIIY